MVQGPLLKQHRARLRRVQVPDSKWCPDCSTLLPAATFYRNGNHLDGLNTWCIKCQKLRRTERQQRRAESLLPVLPAVKRCSGPCGRVLPLAAFNKNPTSPDRRCVICRQCQSLRYRQQNAQGGSNDQLGAPNPPFSAPPHTTPMRSGQGAGLQQ